MPAAHVLDTLADLIRIKSVNPSYEGGVPESELADFVESFCRERGMTTTRQSVLSNRENVIARVPGTQSDRVIVLEAHMDTVGVAGMKIPPFVPDVRDGRMYGRGSCDTKAGLAAMMHAVAWLAEQDIPPACDVWLAATVDEEHTYRGVSTLCEHLLADQTTVDAAMVAEPTSLRPVVASKGLVRFKIETHGTAAHSAKPHLGCNAIEQMAAVIAALQDHTHTLSQTEHALLGPATCNVGTIHGGTQINLVPANCEIEIDRRMIPGETLDEVLADYREVIESIPGVTAEIHPPMLTDLPLQTDVQSQPVQRLVGILRDLKLDCAPMGVPFCSDASKFGAMGIPSMIFGPGDIDQAHSAEEFVSCDQVLLAEKILRRFLSGPASYEEPASR